MTIPNTNSQVSSTSLSIFPVSSCPFVTFLVLADRSLLRDINLTANAYEAIRTYPMHRRKMFHSHKSILPHALFVHRIFRIASYLKTLKNDEPACIC